MSSWKVAPGSGSGSVSTRARPPLLWVLSLPQELPFLGLFCPKSHGQSLLRRWFFDSFSSFVPRFFLSRFLAIRFHLLGFLQLKTGHTPRPRAGGRWGPGPTIPLRGRGVWPRPRPRPARLSPAPAHAFRPLARVPPRACAGWTLPRAVLTQPAPRSGLRKWASPSRKRMVAGERRQRRVAELGGRGGPGCRHGRGSGPVRRHRDGG